MTGLDSLLVTRPLKRILQNKHGELRIATPMINSNKWRDVANKTREIEQMGNTSEPLQTIYLAKKGV